MIPSTRPHIALLSVGPSAEPLLAPLRQDPPVGVRVLSSDEVFSPTGRAIGLLVLLIHPATGQDIAAIHALEQQARATGFGVSTLCVVLTPPAHKPDPALRARTRYALNKLSLHTSATVALPSNSPIDLPAWLAQAVGDMAQSLSDRALVGFDTEDIARLVRHAGASAWASTQANGPDRAVRAVEQLWQHPFLADVALGSQSSAALWISAAAQTCHLREVRDVVEAVQQRLAPEAKLIVCTLDAPHAGAALRVQVLLPGIVRKAPPPRARGRGTTLPAEWLQRQVTPAEAEAAHLVTDERLGSDPVPFGFMHSAWLALQAQMKPGDELWEFCSPAHSWALRCGRQGLVLLRHGQVVAQVTTALN